jgi:hypothetical protein
LQGQVPKSDVEAPKMRLAAKDCPA